MAEQFPKAQIFFFKCRKLSHPLIKIETTITVTEALPFFNCLVSSFFFIVFFMMNFKSVMDLLSVLSE